jgi:hypothetical protein
MSATCPADYGYAPEALSLAPELEAETLYVVGGLYGNPEALEALLALRAREEAHGGPVTLVFNGDFHWFDVQPAVFGRIGAAVAAHVALRGNVEAELARPGGSMDCGCSYPDYVEPGVPERSNAIFVRLAQTASACPGQREALAALPLYRVARVGGRRIAILHGDPESLAGWSLAEEALAGLDGQASAGCMPGAAPETPLSRIEAWFRRAEVDAFATTHTCLPFARDFTVDGMMRLIINNGSAGMPNFRGRHCGLLTRISARPARPVGSLYGCSVAGVRYDALPIAYDHERWLQRFAADWPPGSPAHASYLRRIVDGPDYTLLQAARGRTRPARLRRSA